MGAPILRFVYQEVRRLTLAALSKLDKDDRLFSRDIVAVDMRLPDRLTVQLSDDAAKAREDLFKDKKPKKKAGDA